MKKRNIKGFTLIELLAVIIIMGILMMTAIPAVTKYIENSRKDTFWQTAKSYIDAARTSLLNGEYGVKTQFVMTAAEVSTTTLEDGQPCEVPPAGRVTIVPLSIIEMEKGKGKSSFNRDMTDGYVLVVNEGTSAKDKVVYYFVGVDKGKNGIDQFTSESALGRSKVKKGNATATGRYSLTLLQSKLAAATGEVLYYSEEDEGDKYRSLVINGSNKIMHQVCK